MRPPDASADGVDDVVHTDARDDARPAGADAPAARTGDPGAGTDAHPSATVAAHGEPGPGAAPGGLHVRPYGEHAFLVEVAGLDEVRALDAALRADPPPGTEDVVPAARTVLVRFAAGTPAADVEQHVRAAGCRVASAGGTARGSLSPESVVHLGVHYDGPDLDEVAALTGLTRAEVVARHTGRDHVVAFGGFMPGFAYLAGVDPALHVPRRSSPRERVPAGSVALAGEFTAVYPAATPGGWRLIGRSDAVLFDPGRDRPALLVPGARVRFVDLDAVGGDAPGPAAVGGDAPGPAAVGGDAPGPAAVGGDAPGPAAVGGDAPGPAAVGGGAPGATASLPDARGAVAPGPVDAGGDDAGAAPRVPRAPEPDSRAPDASDAPADRGGRP